MWPKKSILPGLHVLRVCMAMHGKPPRSFFPSSLLPLRLPGLQACQAAYY